VAAAPSPVILYDDTLEDEEETNTDPVRGTWKAD
jgi:hypothetical protein